MCIFNILENNNKMKNKIKAFFIHLSLSFIVISFFISLIIYFWYPLDYIEITNFKNIAVLIISIDLILGPVLTFIVYVPDKKGLYFDLLVIAVLQFSALIYGVYTLYETHPLFITYNHQGFKLIQANEVTPSMAKYEQFRISKLSSPHIAFAKMPDDLEKQTEIMVGVDLKGEPDIDKRTEYYEPYKDHLHIILSGALDKNKIFSKKNRTKEIELFLEKNKNIDSFSFLPLTGINGDATIAIDEKTAEFVGTLHINPWKFVKN